MFLCASEAFKFLKHHVSVCSASCRDFSAQRTVLVPEMTSEAKGAELVYCITSVLLPEARRIEILQKKPLAIFRCIINLARIIGIRKDPGKQIRLAPKQNPKIPGDKLDSPFDKNPTRYCNISTVATSPLLRLVACSLEESAEAFRGRLIIKY